mmetsp:Transcript_9298/g.27947  ORF Transcript_9298/g.27947 Transcript_9298/m.27947 type:complete len:475 (+) Transcript_9298:188-1612(+)
MTDTDAKPTAAPAAAAEGEADPATEKAALDQKSAAEKSEPAADAGDEAAASAKGDAGADDEAPQAEAKGGATPKKSPQKAAAKPRTPAKPAAETLESTTTGRERKQVEAFKPAEAKEVAKFTVQQGKGTKLRDIPNVHFLMDKIKGSDEVMEVLHTVMFKRKGQDKARKRNVLDFSGFTWDTDSKEAERSKATAKLDKLKIDMLHRLLDVFELPRGSGEDGKKIAKVERVMSWLEAPTASDKKSLADKAAKKKTGSAKKAAKKTSGKRKRAADGDNGDEEEGEGDEQEVADETPAKKKKKEDKKQQKKAKKAATKAAKKTPAKKGKKTADPVDASESDDDDTPLGVVASLPKDDALMTKVRAILAGVNVQEFNIRELMNQLEAHYKCDMKSKKPLIKATAVQYCIDNRPADEGDEGEEEEVADEEMEDAPEEPPLAEATEAVKEEAAEAADAAAADEKEAAAEAAVITADNANE